MKDFFYKKSLGQNFLFDKNLLCAITKDAGVTSDDFVVEVGAGAGTLTSVLAENAKEVVSVEIDSRLQDTLLSLDYKNLKVVFGDILKKDIEKDILPLFSKQKKIKLVANLPYYITTPILFKFLECEQVDSITIMVQKEVADRLVAAPNTKDYSAVSVQVASYGEAKITRLVKKENFTPKPNVDSAIVRIDKTKKPCPLLKKVIAAGFAFRRKTLVNNLSAAFRIGKSELEKALATINISPSARAESLGLENFKELVGLGLLEMP